MSRLPPEQGINLEIAEQAMFWYLELLEPQVSEQTRAACVHWRQAHPLHEQAWQRAENLARRMGDMRQHRPLVSAALGGGLPRRRAIKQLALLLAAGVGAWRVRESDLVVPLMADYRSAVGERREVVLADQTRVQLNTDSAINVDLNPQIRRIRLLRGEMLVTLGKDAQERALQVTTAEGHIEALSGRFSLRQRDGYSQLGLLQGQARLLPSQGRTRALAANERVNFTEREVFARRGDVAELAWTQGMIVADGQRLADFLEELSRYRHGRLACDPAVADLRVSGTYPLDDTDRVLAAVSRTLQLDVHSLTRYWVTLSPRTLGG